MTILERKKSLKNLALFLSQYNLNGFVKKNNIPNNDLFSVSLNLLIDRAFEQNPWFTKENIWYALHTWGEVLSGNNIDKWLDYYDFNSNSKSKTIGVIMAGNIPLVGFHDFISVLMSGHKIKAKLSSNDKLLLPLLAKFLIYDNPEFKEKISFIDGILTDIDAVIATGSDNTSRYFDYYFGKYPHIIRKNRNSVAVLSGNETEKQLEGLADDVMLYFGLGCRNVSKIYVPKNYDFNKIFKALLKYKDLINYQKYRNNYDYNKAVYLMSVEKDIRDSLLDNGLVLLKKDVHYSSPIGTIFYEYYENLDEIQTIFKHDKDKIQAIISSEKIEGAIKFGTSQKPQLWDYADGEDVMKFLLEL